PAIHGDVMEVTYSASETFIDSHRKRSPLPLCQLVEDRKRSLTHVPHHLLETQIFSKLKSNNEIQAEPSALHFSGFKLGESYEKNLRLCCLLRTYWFQSMPIPSLMTCTFQHTSPCQRSPWAGGEVKWTALLPCAPFL
uniref:Uncharacterized protein n=1 Tax=Esox lucius TaxID=8010 RepID=A0A6Q2X8K5_ESOLU